MALANRVFGCIILIFNIHKTEHWAMLLAQIYFGCLFNRMTLRFRKKCNSHMCLMWECQNCITGEYVSPHHWPHIQGKNECWKSNQIIPKDFLFRSRCLSQLRFSVLVHFTWYTVSAHAQPNQKEINNKKEMWFLFFIFCPKTCYPSNLICNS